VRFDIGEVLGVFSMVVMAAAHASAMAMVDLLGGVGWLAARYAARCLFARAMYCSSAGVSFLRGRAIR